MELWRAVLIAIANGLAEILPISAFGHFEILKELMVDHSDAFKMIIRFSCVGVMLAIVTFYRKDIAKLFTKNVGKFLIISYVDGNIAETDMSETSYEKSDVFRTSRKGRRDYSTEFDGDKITFGNEGEFSKVDVSLTKIKDFIKGHIHSSMYDTVLLRILDDNGATFIKYRKKEQH